MNIFIHPGYATKGQTGSRNYIFWQKHGSKYIFLIFFSNIGVETTQIFQRKKGAPRASTITRLPSSFTHSSFNSMRPSQNRVNIKHSIFGVIIDCNLTLKDPINNLFSKISANIGIHNKSRNVSKKTHSLPYINHLFTHIQTIVCTFGILSIIHISTKYFFYSKGELELFMVFIREHTLNHSLCLSVWNIYNYNVGLIMYKYHHGMLSYYMSLLLIKKMTQIFS